MSDGRANALPCPPLATPMVRTTREAIKFPVRWTAPYAINTLLAY